MGRVGLMQRISSAVKAFRGAAEAWNAYFGPSGMSAKTKAGTSINESSAMTISAIYAALNFLGGVVASLPLRVYRSLPSGGKEKAFKHPLYDRLHLKPNESGLTSWQWIYTSLLHKYLWGNWWTYLTRPSTELVPLLPDRTRVDVRFPGFVFTQDNQGKEITLDRRDVLLIPHVSIGGVTGKGIVHYARESLGLMKAQEEFASNFFGSGIKAGGFVEVPAEGRMDEDTRKGLQQDFNARYGKLGESWKAIFITGGATWKANEIDATKAQVLESRLFSIAEVSRWTGLPPHLLHDLSRATFSNIEELDLALVIYTLTPIVTQIEQAMDVTFLSDKERAGGYYIKFDLKGLLRGNMQARTAFYTAMLDRGVYNADDVLELEDQNPQPEGLGKLYTMSMAMVNKKQMLEIQSLRVVPDRNVTPQRGAISAPGRVVLQRSSALRRKLTIAYGKQWRAYAKKLLEAEASAVRAGVKEWLGQRSLSEFKAWLNQFYEGFRSDLAAAASPLLSSYADAVTPIAQQEIGNEGDLAPQMQAFLVQKGGYLEAFAQRHISHSRGALLGALEEADPAEDLEAVAEGVLSSWGEIRPERIQTYESVRAENAFARNVFLLAGIPKVRSVYYGSGCPYCTALDGKVIDIQGSFLGEGDFQPDGADQPLVVTGTKRHPPYHGGCDCGIEAEA